MMIISRSFYPLALLATLFLVLGEHAILVAGVDELPREILEKAKLMGELTDQISLTDDRTPCEGCTQFQVFEKGQPFWTVVTRTEDGKCLAVFSDTTTVYDAVEDLYVATKTYCVQDDNDQKICCKTHRGLANAYNWAPYVEEMEEAVRECAKDCSADDDCVILSGFSQGAAVAQIAAMHLRDLNPIQIGLAPPKTFYPDCPLVTSDRVFSFINTMEQDNKAGFSYDLVPFVALPIVGASQLGQLFLISEDETGIAYLGQDALPTEINQGPFSVLAHLLDGYRAKIEAILAALDPGDTTIRTTGFSTGNTCNFALECESGTCTNNLCVDA